MAASSLRLLPRQRSLFHPTSVERCAQIRTPVPQESRASAALERRLSDRNYQECSATNTLGRWRSSWLSAFSRSLEFLTGNAISTSESTEHPRSPKGRG